jgi:hypothetical protein
MIICFKEYFGMNVDYISFLISIAIAVFLITILTKDAKKHNISINKITKIMFFIFSPIPLIWYLIKRNKIIKDIKNDNLIQLDTQNVIEITKSKVIISLTVLSIIGIILFSFSLLVYIYGYYIDGYNVKNEVRFCTFISFRFALAHLIVSLVKAIKHKIKLIRVMSIIGLILNALCHIFIYSLLYEYYFLALGWGITGMLYLLAFSIVVLINSCYAKERNKI